MYYLASFCRKRYWVKIASTGLLERLLSIFLIGIICLNPHHRILSLRPLACLNQKETNTVYGVVVCFPGNVQGQVRSWILFMGIGHMRPSYYKFGLLPCEVRIVLFAFSLLFPHFYHPCPSFFRFFNLYRFCFRCELYVRSSM